MDSSKQDAPNEEHRLSSAIITASEPILPGETESHHPYQAWRYRNFQLLFLGTFIAGIGEQMVGVALGWELYERTGSALILGGVGLMQVLPIFLFSLPAGHIADHFHRRSLVLITQAFLVLGALLLAWLSWTQSAIWLIYACLLFIGTAVAFNDPANETILPQAVPESTYQNAVTWSSSSRQLASVIGPALGGLGIALFQSATLIYVFNAVAALISLSLFFLVKLRPQEPRAREPVTLRSVLEGLRFLRNSKVLLAAITLDMFAVLLGGATTLLPIFAKDILQVGPVGLGWLRAAPAIGAICAALLIAHAPPFKRAGRALLFSVAGFGIATLVFGISQSFWLSLAMLFLLGAFDNVSVVIRHTLLIVRTPDEMRGRISSVNMLFISASNELGSFESGLAAQFLGPVIAVAGGGIGSVLVVLLVALLWPEMRRLRSLSE